MIFLIMKSLLTVCFFTLAQTLTNEHTVEAIFRYFLYVSHFAIFPPLFKLVLPCVFALCDLFLLTFECVLIVVPCNHFKENILILFVTKTGKKSIT